MMFTLQYVTSLMIPEEPERVHIQKSRISAISQKLIEKFEDDDYDKYVDYASDDEMEEKDASKDEEEDHRNKGESNDFARFDASKSSIDCDPQQSMDPESMDPDDDTSDKNNNSGLKRANKGFYQPQLESKQSGWWNSISESFWLPSGERPQSNRRSLSLRFRKQKAYRTRVHHTVSDAIHLSPLAMFDYPYSESVKHWTPPLTKDEVGRESELDILDLDI